MAVSLQKVVLGAIGTLVSSILSIIAVFVTFFFLPLLNSSTFLTASARDLIEDVYPILLVLIPLFTFIGGMITTVVVVAQTSK